MLLLARTTPADKVRKRSEGLSVFIVDLREAQGQGKRRAIDIRKIDAMLNHNTCEVFFDNLELPADNLIGQEGQGFRYIVDSMNAERILIASESLGDARYFIRRATEYAKERVVFGRPIGQNQGVAFPIARSHAQTTAAELLVRKAAALFEAGRECGAEANMGKMLAAEAAWAAGEACMQTFGGFAYAREYGIERKWRETRLYQTAPISTNMILAYVAQHVLGLPRSY
jgi:alkylation response protein AidB-like acyl-CoA dehydrogenase